MAKKSKLTIYVQDETDFSHNGLGVLHPKSCKVERNLLEYTNTMNLVYPIDDTNKWLLLLENRVIKWKQQYYRIYNINKSVEKKEVTAYAKHIFFDLQKNFIFDVNVVNKDGALALTQLLGGTQYSHRFTGHSNIGNKNNLRMVRKNVVDALIGDGNSFINRWGGELDFDGFDFYFNHKIGADKGYKIKYGKNLQGLTLDTNMLSVVTRIVPIGFDGIMLDEKYVDSAYIDNYAMPIIKEYKYEDIKWSGSPNYEENDNDDSVIFDNLADAQAELRRRATVEFTENEVDLPTVTCTVDFLELSKTEEYVEFTHLETVNLGDTVTIYHKPFDVYMKARCIAYTFDVLKDAYESITLGSYVKNYFTESNNVNGQIEDLLDTNLSDKINSVLQVAKDEASKLITSAMGGYVYKTNNALYIMDNEDPKLAKRVWCWNINGLGYSSTGINGQYGLAMTIDGSIVADFIKVGNLNGNLITANTIKIESLELETQQKITNATDEKQVTALIKAGLDGFESSLSETFVTHEQSREDIATAKSETLSDAKEFVTTKLQSYDTIESVNSKIEQSKNAIELEVTSIEEKVEKIETNVNTMQIGGRNLFIGTAKIQYIDVNSPNGYTIFDPYFMPYKLTFEDLGFKDGDTIVVSFNWDITKNNGMDFTYGNFRLEFVHDWTYLGDIKNPTDIFSPSNTSGQVEVTVQFTNETVKANCVRFRFDNSVLRFNVSKFQVERGNKSTEWQPALEDIYDEIDSAKEDAISSSKDNLDKTIANYYTKSETESNINLAKNSITQTVSETYATKSELSTSNDNITNLTNRVQTAENKLTKDSLTTTIGNHYTNSSDVNGIVDSKGYQTASQVKQTVDALQLKFSQSGGYNLLKNGGFENGTAHWTRNGDFTDGKDIWSPYGNGTSWVLWLNTSWSGLYQWFNCRIGQTYSWSMDIYVEQGRCACGIESVNREQLSQTNGWQRMTGTFVATNNQHVFTLYSSQDGTTIHVDNVMVCEGSISSAYTPHPSEVYDGIVTLDKDGIQVGKSDSPIATQMTNNGFYVKQGSNTLLSATSSGLNVSGYATTSSLSTANGTTINGANIKTGAITSTNKALVFSLNDADISVYDPNNARVGRTIRNKITGTDVYGMSTNAEYSNYAGMGIKVNSNDSVYTLGVTCVAKENLVGSYKPGVNIGLPLHVWSNANFKSTVDMENHTIKNQYALWDGFSRSNGDSIYLHKYSTTTESRLRLILTDDYSTYFSISNQHYTDGFYQIANFKGSPSGTSGSSSTVGINFFRTLNLNNWGIYQAGVINGATLKALSLDVESDEIQVRTTSNLALLTTDDFTEIDVPTKTQYLSASTTKTINHHGKVTVTERLEYVELPSDYIMCENINVTATPNKLCRFAITSVDEYGFVIECDEDDVTFNYTVIGDKIDIMSLKQRKMDNIVPDEGECEEYEEHIEEKHKPIEVSAV